MPNRNSETAVTQRFHDATKYTLVGEGGTDASILMGAPPNLGPAMGEQDLAIEPAQFKIYPALEPIPLPTEPLITSLAALDAIAATGEGNSETSIPDLATISALLLRSNGLLKRWHSPWGREVNFRAASCTGARYHLELYLICADLLGLPAGIYHYGVHDHALRRLRGGDYRSVLVEATGSYPAVGSAPATIASSSAFWRNAWRYQERAYRHAYWDTGTLYANLLAVAASAGLPTEVVLGFDDWAINRLLGLDGEDEATLGLVTLGHTDEPISQSPPVDPLDLEVEPYSSREIEFPAIQELHLASGLDSGTAAATWRNEPLVREVAEATGSVVPLKPIGSDAVPDESIEEVIQRRRSNRHYAADQPLPFDQFSTVIDRATRPTIIDALDQGAPPLHDLFLIVNNVEGLESGTYRYLPGEGVIELLREGDHRAAAAQLACGQEYTANAHVNVYALTDLEPVLERYGNRGYRLAQLEAALMAGRLQLAAHALGLGAVGSTSVDDEVTAHFSSADEDAGSFMFVAVFGIKRKPSQTETEQKSRYLNRDRTN
jgi:SagB-type dehydrogenase family enzyme